MLVALDTATLTASLALYDLETDALLAEQTWLARRRQTEETLPALKEMVERLGRSPEAIQAVAVTTGPGSFTGVRIGISIAKGIALGLSQAPRLLGLPTLSVTAAPFLELAPTAGIPRIWAVLQAGRGRFNWAVFQAGDLLHRPTAADHGSGLLEDLLAALTTAPGPIWLLGETSPALMDAAAALPHVHPVEPVAGLRRAGSLARLAKLHLAAGVEDDLNTLQPLYLRTLG